MLPSINALAFPLAATYKPQLPAVGVLPKSVEFRNVASPPLLNPTPYISPKVVAAGL